MHAPLEIDSETADRNIPKPNSAAGRLGCFHLPRRKRTWTLSSSRVRGFRLWSPWLSALLLCSAVGYMDAQASTRPGAPATKTDAGATVPKQITDAQTAGAPLSATINVADNVNIEAVMLPKDIARGVFGRKVADSYAVIEVNISNRSNDAALILQSLYIDLSQWGFAGPLGGAKDQDCGQPGKTYVSCSQASQVASVEYRIVRGQMLDAPAWTTRNWALRAMQAMGSIGVAFAFPFTKDVVAGIGAWNGAVVPGYQSLFPDALEGQIERISDFGFRDNKVIPQQSSDIVVSLGSDRPIPHAVAARGLSGSPVLVFQSAADGARPKDAEADSANSDQSLRQPRRRQQGFSETSRRAPESGPRPAPPKQQRKR